MKERNIHQNPEGLKIQIHNLRGFNRNKIKAQGMLLLTSLSNKTKARRRKKVGVNRKKRRSMKNKNNNLLQILMMTIMTIRFVLI
jgi:hypothetical protein